MAGNRAGITSIVVLTGVTTKEMIAKSSTKAKESEDFDKNYLPDLVITYLEEIFE
ncbi:MAG: HAD hydrolase-like protein [Promethearchaeota archaeon]